MGSALFHLKGSIRWLRNELPRLVSNYRLLGHKYVAVGWDAQAGTYEDGTPVAVVALANEFGTETVPARPFVRPAYAENRPALLALRTQLVNRVNAGTIAPEKALDVLGFRMQAWIRKKILSNVGPPLAASTVARKRAEGRPVRTLVNTRRMLDELTYRIYLGPLASGSQSNAARAAQARSKVASAKTNASARARMQKIRTANQVRGEKGKLKRELREAKSKSQAGIRRAKAKAKSQAIRAKVDAQVKSRRVAAKARAQKESERLGKRNVARRDKERAAVAKARTQKNQKIAAIRTAAKLKRVAMAQKAKTLASTAQIKRAFSAARKGIANRNKAGARQAVNKRYGAPTKPTRSAAAKEKSKGQKQAARLQRQDDKKEHDKKVSATRKTKAATGKQKQTQAENKVRERYAGQRNKASRARKSRDELIASVKRNFRLKGAAAEKTADRIIRMSRKPLKGDKE